MTDAKSPQGLSAEIEVLPPPGNARRADRAGRAFGAKIFTVEQIALLRRELADGAGEAVALLRRTVNDDKAPVRSRVDAARALLDRAGVVPPPKRFDAEIEKPASEMSTDELRALVDAARDELAERARPVEVEPEGEDADADFLK